MTFKFFKSRKSDRNNKDDQFIDYLMLLHDKGEETLRARLSATMPELDSKLYLDAVKYVYGKSVIGEVKMNRKTAQSLLESVSKSGGRVVF